MSHESSTTCSVFSTESKAPKPHSPSGGTELNEILAEDDLITDDPEEIALRQKGYPFPAALRTEQGQQWWLRYSAARKIYSITVKPEDWAALPWTGNDKNTGMHPLDSFG